jgi:hypothetical protein
MTRDGFDSVTYAILSGTETRLQLVCDIKGQLLHLFFDVEFRANDFGSRLNVARLHPQINGNAMANDSEKYGKIIGMIFFSQFWMVVNSLNWTLNSNAAETLPWLFLRRSRKTSKSLSISQKPKASETKD